MTVDVFRLLEFGVGRVPVLVDFEQNREQRQTEQHVRTRLSEAGRDIEIVAHVVSVELGRFFAKQKNFCFAKNPRPSMAG